MRDVLAAWSTIFGQLRILARLNQALPITGLLNRDPAAIFSYYLPVIVFLSILGLFALILSITAIFLLLSNLFPKRLVVESAIRLPASRRRKFIVLLVSLFVSVAVLSMISLNIGGSYCLTSSISSSESEGLAVMFDTQSLLDSFQPAINTIFTGLMVAANSTIDLATGVVSFDNFTAAVYPSLNLIIGSWIAADKLKNQVITTSAVIVQNTTQMMADSNVLFKTIEATNTAVSNLNLMTPVSSNNRTLYNLTRSINYPISASATLNATRSTPNTTAIFSALQSINLTSYAVLAQYQLDSSLINAKTVVSAANLVFKNQLSNDLKRVQAGVLSNYQIILNALNVGNVTQVILAQFAFLQNVDNIRGTAQVIIMLNFATPIILIAIAVKMKRYRYIKLINLLCIPYYVLIFAMAIAATIIAVGVGDVCYGISDQSNVSLSAIYPHFGYANTVINQCHNGSTLLQVASNIGIVNSSNLDFKALTTNTLNKANFTAISNLNATALVNQYADPNLNFTSLVPFKSLNTSSFDAIISGCSILENSLAGLRAALLLLNSTTTTLNLSFNPTSAPAVDKNQALLDFRKAVGNIVASIDSYSPSTIDNLSVEASNLKQGVIIINSTATDIVALVNSFHGLYIMSKSAIVLFVQNAQVNITQIIPVLKNAVLTAVQLQTTYFNTVLTCQKIADGIFSAKQGICVDILEYLDVIWSTLVILALISLLSFPLLGSLARVFYPNFGINITKTSNQLRMERLPPVLRSNAFVEELKSFNIEDLRVNPTRRKSNFISHGKSIDSTKRLLGESSDLDEGNLI